MGMKKKFISIVQVRWELPFPLMLPQQTFLCWEPTEGVAAFDPEGQVGSLMWKRTCNFLASKTVFLETPKTQDPRSLPTHNYLIRSKLVTGEEITTGKIDAGPEGGFSEARPYTIANIFLCMTEASSYADRRVVERASAALNNIIETYRFLTLDPLSRPLHNEDDHYCTTISEALIPVQLQQNPLEDLLSHVGEFSFGSTIGKDRMYTVGTNSYEDLVGNKLPSEGIRQFYGLACKKHELELFHQLVFSAIRKLKRKEGALAIIDTQSAFEAAVASMLRDGLTLDGWNQSRIDQAFAYNGNLHLLQPRLVKLDALAEEEATNTGRVFEPFLGSSEETEWRQYLYNLRNEIVHKGRREANYEEAKRAIVIGLKAIYYLQNMSPLFTRQFMWTEEALELQHIRESAGRLSRLFEA